MMISTSLELSGWIDGALPAARCMGREWSKEGFEIVWLKTAACNGASINVYQESINNDTETDEFQCANY